MASSVRQTRSYKGTNAERLAAALAIFGPGDLWQESDTGLLYALIEDGAAPPVRAWQLVAIHPDNVFRDLDVVVTYDADDLCTIACTALDRDGLAVDPDAVVEAIIADVQVPAGGAPGVQTPATTVGTELDNNGPGTRSRVLARVDAAGVATFTSNLNDGGNVGGSALLCVRVDGAREQFFTLTWPVA